ncbi:adenosine deaminase [Patescibacteria group bacterium]|nr:adenosine deaminase [Patescibacteria group bacterium]
MPKAELHVHLEGTMDPGTLLALARRHGLKPIAPDEESISAWYRFDGFAQFLDRYFAVLELLVDPEDFALVAQQYLLTAHDQGAVHVEFHVSACGHIIENARPWGPIHSGIVEGCQRAEEETGITWGLIPDISPHLPAGECAVAMDEVMNHDLTGVVAIGMGGPADTWITDDFTPIFCRAREKGLHVVSHAAEHGGPAEVAYALEHFGVDRIQHGIGIMQDRDVVAQLIEQQVPCDVCPGSNLALHAVDAPEQHPLPAMIDAGITVTLSTDDPPMFHTTLLDEYERAWNWCGLDLESIEVIARNSLEAAFADLA